MEYVIIGIIIVLFVVWIISAQHRLIGMGENIDYAINQLSIQFSSLFDALIILLNLTKEYADHECQLLIDTIKSRRSTITADSTPEDIHGQERLISEVLEHIFTIAAQYPALKTNENYVRCLNAVDNYEKTISTSRLIYNDNVTRLNRELHMFPTSLIAHIFGIHERDYLEALNEVGMEYNR